jgi:uncharacterized protein YndB with AHSA1/START domain
MTTANHSSQTPTAPPTSAPAPLTITRYLNAPRDVVFKAWTDPAQLAQWWSPHGFTRSVDELDARPGGLMRGAMRGPDGAVYPDTGMFHEIVPPERLVFTSVGIADEAGRPLLEVRNTVTFADLGGRTKLTLQAVVVTAAPAVAGALAGMAEGWSQSLDKLAEYLATGAVAPSAPRHTGVLTLPSDRAIAQTRIFDAPRDQLFQVYTDPQRIPQWWGPKRHTTIVDQMDVRPGGVWRFVTRYADGHEEDFHGEYREIAPPERIVQTFEWEGQPGHVAVETLTLEDLNGQTRMTVTSVFDTAADRDGMLEPGAEEGARESWDRLAALLAQG